MEMEAEETCFCGGRGRVNPHFQLKYPGVTQKKKFLIPERADHRILDGCTRLVAEEVSKLCRNTWVLEQWITLYILCIQRSCS